MRVKLLTIKQVEEVTSIARRTLYAWAADPNHPFPKPINISNGRKGLRWREGELYSFIEKLSDKRLQKAADINCVLRGERRRAPKRIS